MKKRIPPPKELKLDLMAEVGEQLARRFPAPHSAITYLLNMFTTFDLVGIRDELKEKDRRDAIQSRVDRQKH
jgi:hypothetical protein